MIPYSHKDAAQTLRLLKWIGFMESFRPSSLSKAAIILVASMTAAKMEIFPQIDAALRSQLWATPDKRIFASRHYVLKEEYEQGWPGACNFMFAKALDLVRDDAFLLEPDAIPLCPDWWDIIQAAWKEREPGQEFMGNYSADDIPHMTGIGVYGKNWQSVAPKIAEIQNVRGWDTYAADQILPRAKITPLIQHIWRNPRIDSLSILSPDAVVFHQDKSGHLISLLDQEHFGCAADRATGYSAIPIETKVMTRYFKNENATRAVQSNGLEFRFEMVDCLGGVWLGVFSTDVEAEALALEVIMRNNGAIKEISAEEFSDLLESKKKARPSQPLIASAQQALPAVQVSQRPALLVDDPENSPIPIGEQPTLAPRAASVDEVLKVGRVVPPETNRPKGKGSRK
jgi:hypothetical protein